MTQARERFVPLLTVLGWIALVALICAGYLGKSTSPYGACYSSSGRNVPCEVLARK